MTRDDAKSAPRGSEAGFTLVEVLTAIVILAFGLIAVTNLLVVASGSSQIANTGTTAAAIASEQMEMLKTLPFVPLPAGGASLTPQACGATVCGNLDADVAGYFRNSTTDPRLRVPGGGIIWVRWQVTYPVNGQAQLAHIAVRAEAQGVFGRRTRAEFTVFRSCTGPVPDQGTCRNNPTVNDTPCCPVAP